MASRAARSLSLLGTLSGRGGSLIHGVVGGSVSSRSRRSRSGGGGRRGGSHSVGLLGGVGGGRSIVVLDFILVRESALDDLDLGATAGALNVHDVLVIGGQDGL